MGTLKLLVIRELKGKRGCCVEEVARVPVIRAGRAATATGEVVQSTQSLPDSRNSVSKDLEAEACVGE